MLMLFVLGPLTDAEVQKRDEALEREKAWLARARAAEAERPVPPLAVFAAVLVVLGIVALAVFVAR